MFLALAVLASATLSVSAKDKKEKKNKNVEAVVEAPAVTLPEAQLVSEVDSASYAIGISQSKGLMEFLIGRMQLDTMYIADFKQAFIEALDRGTDPKFVAQRAGINIAQQVQEGIMPQAQGVLTNLDMELNNNAFLNGFLAGAFEDASVMTREQASKIVDEKQEAAKTAYIEKNKQWLVDNAQKSGVITLESGLQYKVLTEGTGKVAGKDENVTVKYEGKTIDGNIFDSSYKRTPDTTTFKPTQVIKGWTEALCMMPEGSVWELYIPSELAYGERGAGNGEIKPNSTLIFKVEIVKVGE